VISSLPCLPTDVSLPATSIQRFVAFVGRGNGRCKNVAKKTHEIGCRVTPTGGARHSVRRLKSRVGLAILAPCPPRKKRCPPTRCRMRPHRKALARGPRPQARRPATRPPQPAPRQIRPTR